MAESPIQTREQRLSTFLADPEHRVFTEEVSGRFFLEFPQFDGRESAPVASPECAQYVPYWSRKKHGKRLPEKEVKELVSDLIDRCRFDSPPPRRRFFLRTAEHDGTLYLDLADDRRQVVAIGAGGVQRMTACPVSFQRPCGMAPLPLPEDGGQLEDLWAVLPGSLTEDQRWLLLGWALSTFDPTVEPPVLVLCGPAGSGKSSIATVLQGLTDPSLAGLGGGLNCSDRDLRVALSNSWVYTADNLSGLTPAQSDTFCQRVTGGVLRSREHYSNHGEVIRPIRGPVIFTCITNVVEKPDLLSRCLVIDLPELPDGSRRGKNEVLAEFQRQRPRLLGLLLRLVASGLQVPPRPEHAAVSRLTDAVTLVERCFEAGGLPAGAFARAVSKARVAVVAQPLDAWLVTPYLLARFPRAEGMTASQALYELTQMAKEDGVTRHRDWPKRAAEFAKQLRHYSEALRSEGLLVEPPTSHSGKGRVYRFTPLDAAVAAPKPPAADSDTAVTAA